MSTEITPRKKKITIRDVGTRKAATGSPRIVALTAYDYTFAKLFDEIVDVVLVGDSLGMVIQGENNTLSVTMDAMVYHSRAVARGLQHAHLVADMPFLSYQTGKRDAIRNAGRLLAEGHAEAVKIEGGVAIAPTVAALVSLGIPVMGHIGLEPQKVHTQGGYRIQGRTEKESHAILEDALALESAGVYSIVLEGIPSSLATQITSRLKIPTIGIGAGAACDGQILVSQDLLGLNTGFHPRFVKHFAKLDAQVKAAVMGYAEEVRDGKFPGEEHSF